MYCGLFAPIFDSDIKTFSTTLTRGIKQDLASHQQTPHGSVGIGDMLERWICRLMLEAYNQRRMWLSMFQWNGLQTLSEHPWARPGWRGSRVHDFCHANPVYLWDRTHPSLDSKLSGPEGHILQEWNIMSLPLKISPQGSWRIIRETLLTFLTIGDTKKLLAVPLITTVTASAKRDNACAYHPVKYPQKLSQFHSYYNSCVLDA